MKPAKASGAMNFFAKRPKTPAEVVKQVRDLLAPGGRLDGSVGNVDGRKKVSPSSPPTGLRAICTVETLPCDRSAISLLGGHEALLV